MIPSWLKAIIVWVNDTILVIIVLLYVDINIKHLYEYKLRFKYILFNFDI